MRLDQCVFVSSLARVSSILRFSMLVLRLCDLAGACSDDRLGVSLGILAEFGDSVSCMCLVLVPMEEYQPIVMEP